MEQFVPDGKAGGSHPGPPARRLHPLAYGIERIGLIALRAPVVGAIIFALLVIGAVFGLDRLKVDDSLSQLFRSDTPEFKQFEQVATRFPSSEFDVLIVIEGKVLLHRDELSKLRDAVTDLQLIDGTRGLISLFSARQPPENGGCRKPCFPETLPTGAAYDELIARSMSNEIIRGKLLSDDGELRTDRGLARPLGRGGRQVGAGDRRDAQDDGRGHAGTSLSVELSGVPVMQLEIRNAVERDRLVYNTIGFLAGCLIAILFFRRVSFMIVAAGPPLPAIVFALGALGWLGFRLNMFLNVMTPLIMVISFSDSMQLTFAARDRLIAGESKADAFRNAILVVGPACVLTHATAGLSFVALLFSNSDLIRTFGEAGIIATVIALVTVLMLLPILGVLLIRRETAFAANIRQADTAVHALRRFCDWIARKMVHRAGLYSLVAVLVVGVLGYNYANLQPRYRLADQVPDKEHAVEANQRLDTKLTGANPIDVLIEFPPGASLYSPQTLATIADVHAAVERQAGVGNVWSLETLRRWLREKAGITDVETLKEYVNLLPVRLVRRFISADQNAVVVSGRIPDVELEHIAPGGQSSRQEP